MSKRTPKTTTQRFQVGEYAWWTGMNNDLKPPLGPFLITRIDDMTGYYGWEDGTLLVALKGLLPTASTQLIPDVEYKAQERARRKLAKQFNMKFSIHNGVLRITT